MSSDEIRFGQAVNLVFNKQTFDLTNDEHKQEFVYKVKQLYGWILEAQKAIIGNQEQTKDGFFLRLRPDKTYRFVKAFDSCLTSKKGASYLRIKMIDPEVLERFDRQPGELCEKGTEAVLFPDSLLRDKLDSYSAGTALQVTPVPHPDGLVGKLAYKIQAIL